MLNRLLNQEQSGKTSKGGSAFQKIGKGEAGAAPVGERWLGVTVHDADGARLRGGPRVELQLSQGRTPC